MPDKPIMAPWALSAHDWQVVTDCLRAADLDALEITTPQKTFRLVREADGYRLETFAPRLAGVPAMTTATLRARAPCAGTFLDAHPLQTQPAVLRGSRVAAGRLLGYVQIDSLLAPVVAPVTGIVGDRLVVPGTLVGYGAELFSLQEEHV